MGMLQEDFRISISGYQDLSNKTYQRLWRAIVDQKITCRCTEDVTGGTEETVTATTDCGDWRLRQMKTQSSMSTGMMLLVYGSQSVVKRSSPPHHTRVAFHHPLNMQIHFQNSHRGHFSLLPRFPSRRISQAATQRTIVPRAACHSHSLPFPRYSTVVHFQPCRVCPFYIGFSKYI